MGLGGVSGHQLRLTPRELKDAKSSCGSCFKDVGTTAYLQGYFIIASPQFLGAQQTGKWRPG